MDAMEALFTRRSIRAYTDEPIKDEHLQKILEAAMVSPSALDERPWQFVVVKNRDALKALSGEMQGCEMLEQATLGLIVCGDTSKEKIPGFWIQDCCACCENILLAAHAQGVGACWIAIHSVEERVNLFREKFGLPAHIIPLALMSMGYPGEELPGEDRFDESLVHQEKWNG